MNDKNRLATSIGIELTFVPRYCTEFYAKNGVCLADSLVHQFASVLGRKLSEANITVSKCTTDPNCVEVPTVAHTRRNKLNEDIRAITKLAKSADLIPQPDYFCGGGAHIHAGIQPLVAYGEEYQSRNAAVNGLAQRVQVFAAQNPWLCWAFSGINDRHNARPLNRGKILNKGDKGDLKAEVAHYTVLVENYTNRVIRYTKDLHTTEQWSSNYSRLNMEDCIDDTRRAMMRARYRLLLAKRALARMGGDPAVFAYSETRLVSEKSYVVVYRGNTMEFRAFIMPHNTKDLGRYVRLVEAVMLKGQAELANESFQTADLWDGEPMPYRQARAGFLAMLEGLGLDPDAYRADLYRMALRARYAKAQNRLT